MAEHTWSCGQAKVVEKLGNVICCFYFSIVQQIFILYAYVYMVLFICCIQDHYQGFPFIQFKSCLSCFWNRSCVCCFGLLLRKGEAFSLWHIYLWKLDWWQVFSNVKCLCKLMMIIWYAMPCYYHVITMLKLLIFTWHLIHDRILWYWHCLYYFCIWSPCKFPVRIKNHYGLKW